MRRLPASFLMAGEGQQMLYDASAGRDSAPVSPMDMAIYRRAKARVEALKALWTHALMFAVICGGFFLLDMLTTPGRWWFYWPTAMWGIALATHFFIVVVRGSIFGREWEERKLRQFLLQEERNRTAHMG